MLVVQRRHRTGTAGIGKATGTISRSDDGDCGADPRLSNRQKQELTLLPAGTPDTSCGVALGLPPRSGYAVATETTNRRAAAVSMGARNTWRKRQIRELLRSSFARRAVLLDELRWAVFSAQLPEDDNSGPNITRSWLNSFARTIREQLPAEFRIEKIEINKATLVGLVARTALYRLRSVAALRRFLRATEPSILCRYKTDLDVEDPRYQLRYVTPQYHVATFRFFEQPPKSMSYDQLNGIPGTLIPATQKLTIVLPRAMEVDLARVAVVPWKLYGYHELNDWYEVSATDRLDAVHRDRQV